ncbi:MAG: type II toxin-antitoxin system VapC family toxin [Pseudonocardiaceae bacterium]
MIVVDASVLVTALVDDGPDGRGVRDRLRSADLAAPAHLDVEFLHALRGLVRSQQTSPQRADRAIDHLVRMPLQRFELPAVASRTWQLRDNLTSYDAAYVALAELLSASLVTSDARLTRATGPRCIIELIRPARAD